MSEYCLSQSGFGRNFFITLMVVDDKKVTGKCMPESYYTVEVEVSGCRGSPELVLEFIECTCSGVSCSKRDAFVYVHCV